MSNFAPRLVATDLDGTIVRDDGTISARTVAALALIERAGAAFVLVTGRPPRWLDPVAQTIQHRGLAICANGALVYDLHTKTVVRAHLIEPPVIAEAVVRLRRADPELSFAVEQSDGFAFEERYGLGRWDHARFGSPVVDEAGLAERPAAKLLASRPGIDSGTLVRRARETLGGLLTATNSSSNGLVELSAYGVSKASALAELCADLGIAAADVAAFGDMPNDLPMLTWAGRSYAVANAHPDVLAAVGREVASVDDDGVARTIEDFFALSAPP